MPRPRSIYERSTESSLPPPAFRERRHAVEQGESLISIANREYRLSEYDPDLWRGIGELNGVENPFTLATDFSGTALRIPAKQLPEFL
jgi:nucleoid-associated protein YgaU